MSSRAQLVSQAVEHALARRVSAPFAPSTRVVERTIFGIDALDEAAQGGAPLGAITELIGPPCSGRTTAASSLVSRFTSAGSVCAWIDVADALNPESAAATGVDLSRLLWVRCGAAQSPAHHVAPSQLPMASGAEVSAPRTTGGGSPHPRAEGRDMPQAIQAMLGAHGGLLDHQARRERKAIGTPGAPNRPLSGSAPNRQEQVPTDRLPPRRGEHLSVAARCAEPQPRRVLSVASPKRRGNASRSGTDQNNAGQGKPWQALDQALRATDLLLMNGGFAAIVLDLGSTPAEFAWRIPMATWFRYRAACERSHTSLLLLTQHPCARSSAGLVMRLQLRTTEAEGPVMTAVHFQATAERSRFAEPQARVIPIRKSPQSDPLGSWKSEAAWA